MSKNNYQEDLTHIRQMMERSTKFISLSGMSGVAAGIIALCGAIYVYLTYARYGIDYFENQHLVYNRDLEFELLITGFVILVCSIIAAYIFTARKSKKQRLKIWDSSMKRFLVNFSIPLFTGGIVCLALIYHESFALVAPITLIFYGLSLVNAEKYTLSELKYLGLSEIFLGVIGLFILGWGLVLWALGFGILHIIYGIVMYKKYK